MDRFDGRIEQQNYESKIASIREHIGGIPQDLSQSIEATYPGAFDRLESVLDYVLTLVSSSDPALVAAPVINQTTTLIDQIASYLMSAIQQHNASYFANVESSVEALAAQAALWPGQARKLTSQEISKAASSYKKSLTQQLISVKDEAAEVIGQVRAFEERLEQAKPQLDTAVLEAHQRMTEQVGSIDARLTEVRTTIDNEKARLDQLIATHQQQFAEAQEDRLREGRAITSQFEERVQEIIASTHNEVQNLLAQIASQKTQAEELVGYISATGTASAYGDEAATQAGVANRLRAAAIAVALAASGVAIWAVAHGVREGQSIIGGVTKIVTAAALYGIAGYLANQSARHRQREEAARKRELELIAFGPFVAELDEDKRQEARAALVNRLFGRDSNDLRDEKTVLTEDNISLLGRVIEMVTRAKST